MIVSATSTAGTTAPWLRAASKTRSSSSVVAQGARRVVGRPTCVASPRHGAQRRLDGLPAVGLAALHERDAEDGQGVGVAEAELVEAVVGPGDDDRGHLVALREELDGPLQDAAPAEVLLQLAPHAPPAARKRAETPAAAMIMHTRIARV